jgi:hypothetical protein
VPLKMEPIECSETSAINTQTPGKHPNENILHLYTTLCMKICLKVGSYTRMQFEYEGYGLVVSACNVVDGTSVEGNVLSLLSG